MKVNKFLLLSLICTGLLGAFAINLFTGLSSYLIHTIKPENFKGENDATSGVISLILGIVITVFIEQKVFEDFLFKYWIGFKSNAEKRKSYIDKIKKYNLLLLITDIIFAMIFIKWFSSNEFTQGREFDTTIFTVNGFGVYCLIRVFYYLGTRDNLGFLFSEDFFNQYTNTYMGKYRIAIANYKEYPSTYFKELAQKLNDYLVLGGDFRVNFEKETGNEFNFFVNTRPEHLYEDSFFDLPESLFDKNEFDKEFQKYKNIKSSQKLIRELSEIPD